MSKYLLKEYISLCPSGACNIGVLTEEERRMKDNGEMLLTGILQVADTKNGNSRIYPRNVLDRELKNYQKLIKENRALGECVEEGSKILTEDGWKDFRDVKEGDNIYTLNLENSKVEIQPIDVKIDKKYVGDIYHFQGIYLDIRVTPEHKFILLNSDNKYEVVKAVDIYEQWQKYKEYSFLRILPSIDKKVSSMKVGIIVEKEQYDGKVYCVSVKNKTFYCSKNGKSFISHNCDHSDESVVSLKNASHMILRTWWDNNNIMGVLKVLKTPSGNILRGLVESGVNIGISSRGLGSLKETRNGDIVQDDFLLICWDIVSEASAPGAYLHLQENKLFDLNEKSIFSKPDRIYRIINDILSNR